MINYGLKDKVAIITGANNPWGIGATTALAFVREETSAHIGLQHVYKNCLQRSPMIFHQTVSLLFLRMRSSLFNLFYVADLSEKVNHHNRHRENENSSSVFKKNLKNLKRQPRKNIFYLLFSFPFFFAQFLIFQMSVIRIEKPKQTPILLSDRWGAYFGWFIMTKYPEIFKFKNFNNPWKKFFVQNCYFCFF